MFTGLWLKGLALAALCAGCFAGFMMVRNAGYRQCQVEYADRDTKALEAARTAVDGPRRCRDTGGVWSVITATCDGSKR